MPKWPLDAICATWVSLKMEYAPMCGVVEEKMMMNQWIEWDSLIIFGYQTILLLDISLVQVCALLF